MSHSFLSYGNSEVRLHDTDLAVCVYLFSQMAEKNLIDLNDNERALLKNWHSHVNNTAPGLFDFGLEDFLDTKKLSRLITLTINQIEPLEHNIPKEILNESTRQKKEVFLFDYPKDDALQALQSILNLVKN